MRSLSRTSLATRLSVLVIATSLPLVALLIVNYVDARSERRQNGVTQARAYVRNIGTLLDGAARDIDSYMSAAALVIGSQPGPIDSDNTSSYLAGLQKRYPNLNSLFITDLNGKVLAQASGSDTGFDVSSRPYMQALMKGVEKTWTTQTAIRSGELIAAYGRVIPNLDRSPRAYLVASFKPTDTIGSRPKDFPGDGNLFIVGADGKLIVSYREPDVSKAPRDVSEDPTIARTMQGEAVDIEDSNTEFDSGQRYGAVVPVPQMGWSVGYTRSQELLDSEVRDRLVRDLGLLLGITAMTLIIVIYVARRMVRPLSRLAVAAEDISAGCRVALATRGADPDIRKLESAFATMSTAVAEREDLLRDQARTLAALEQVGARLASDLDYTHTIQSVTDAGTELTEAEFGAFFYGAEDEKGESNTLYTLSGLDPSRMQNFPMRRDSDLFKATFAGSILRLDDVTTDTRYATPLSNGAAAGNRRVRSYMAVPVLGSDDEVTGGLFFGHTEPEHFTQHHQTLAMGIAAWASIALDNARLYRESQEVQEQLRAANAAKDEFLALVSHELRTPTTTIYGGVRILDTRRDILGPDATAELIHTMSEETERLVRLIENLLVFARLELGRMPDREPLSINQLAEQVVTHFSRTHRSRPLETNLEDSLPLALAQSTSIEQVLTNFLSNADKYSPPGQPITVITRALADSVEVIVRDRGNGVSSDDMAKIFESFYRASDAPQRATGHGLGLSVSKKIIDAHEGRIFARNLNGTGFEIGFTVPAAEMYRDSELTELLAVGDSV